MKKKLQLIVVLFFALLNLQAQQQFNAPHHKLYNQSKHHCGAIYKQALDYDRDPTLHQKRQASQQAAQKWYDQNKSTYFQQLDSHIYEIPVVIHVVYANQTQNISEAQIQSQIQILNQDFTKTNPDISNVPFVFSMVTADVGFTFCLATTDPNGQPTTGINRIQTTTRNIGDINTGNIYYSSAGGYDAWDEDKYLNIWVCEIDSNGTLLGYASFPGTASFGEDGIVMDYKFFGTQGTVLAPYDGGRTLTHEVGHYFNLSHIWGDGDCTVDDGVFDTPLQESEYGGCPSFPQSSCGSDDMFMNYMDYTNDDCLHMFTGGQKTRMHTALNSDRSGLITNNPACQLTSVYQLENAIRIYPNPTRQFVEWEGDISIDGIYLYDSRGALVQQWSSTPTSSLDISSVIPGLYQLVFKTKTGIIVKRISKQD